MSEEQGSFTYVTTKPFTEVLAAIEASAMKRSFRTLHTHNVQATLDEKGFSIEPYSIMEVCNAPFAYKMIQKFKPVGTMLPCRILVYAEGENTTVILMKPTLIAQMIPGQDFGTIPQEVETLLREAVEEAVA